MPTNPYESPIAVRGIAPRRLAPWHILFLLLAIVGGLGTSYFSWSWHRVSNDVLINDDESWPRPPPYPDQWLWELNDWFDRRYPAPRGYFKLHGELERVRLTVFGCIALSLTILGIGLFPFARGYLRRRANAGIVNDSRTFT